MKLMLVENHLKKRKMAKDKLTKKQKRELEKLIKEITEQAKSVIEDYSKNPSEISGSVVQIHEDSPFLKE